MINTKALGNLFKRKILTQTGNQKLRKNGATDKRHILKKIYLRLYVSVS